MSGISERPAGRPGEDVDLRRQIDDLRSALDVIRSGGVDAVMMKTAQGNQIYTLDSADRPYRTIVEEMGEGAATVSERGIVLYANRRLAELLGCDRSSILGQDMTDLVPSAHQAALAELLQATPGATRRAELEFVTRSVGPVPVQVSVTGLDVEGVLVRCLVATDLTNRRRAEQKIAEANTALQATATELAEAQRVAHVGSWIWDRSADRMQLSAEACSILMFPRTAGALTFVQAFGSQGLHGDGSLATARDLAEGERGSFEYPSWFRLQDGSLRHVLIRGEALTDELGQVTGMRGTVQDVTALTQTRQALERSTARFVAAFEHAPAGMALVDADGLILHANQALSDLTRVPLDRLSGRSLDAFVQRLTADEEPCPPPSPLWMPTPRSERQRLLDEPTGAEARLVTADGDMRWITVKLAPIQDMSGDHYAIVHIEDISYTRSLIEASLDPLVTIEPGGTITDVNAATEQVTGCSRAELVGTEFSAYFTDPGLARAGYEQVFRDGTVRDYPLDLRHRDGRTTPVLYNASVYRDAAGQVVGVFAAARDITERKRAEASARQLAAIVESSDDAIISKALDGTILTWNPGAQRLYGYTAEEIVGRPVSVLVPPDRREELDDLMRRVTRGEHVAHTETRRLPRQGPPLDISLSVSPLLDASGQVVGVSTIARDITERKRAEQQLAHRASHDDLTGLPNRALLLEHLAKALARSWRTGSRVGVLFLDLDDFKSINDSYGHGAGDELLARVAVRISTSIRASDVVARIGGDEFVIVCENLKESSDAALVADQIQRALTGQILLRGHSVTAGASVGIALSHPDCSPESMLRDADAAMYVAKRRGGRRWEPADESLHTAAIRVLAVEGELHRALERRELRVYYQPLIDLATEAIVAVEALLRWQHPDRGLILPADFVDVAEQRGLIGDIGTWVLRTACDQATIWHLRYGQTAPSLAVNVSSRQLDHQGIGTHITQALETSQLPADRLVLEVTESQLLGASRSSMNDLRTLATRGIRVAVDDFGTGHAGFDYLRRLPVHELKIDRSFIDGTGSDPTDTAITASIVTLGLSLGLTVVAEGIETPRQLHTLRDLGCTWGQGWLWHPALPAEDIDALLAARGCATATPASPTCPQGRTPSTSPARNQPPRRRGQR